MRLCKECGTWYPNFDDAGQPMERCPDCGIPFDNDEATGLEKNNAEQKDNVDM